MTIPSRSPLLTPLNLTLLSWILTTIASVFAAKFACDAYGINPVVLSMFQFFVASTLLQLQSLLSGVPFRRPGYKHLLWLLVISVGVFLRETLKFAAVANVGINVFNALKSLGPVILVLLDGALFRIWPARATVLPFLLLSLGGVVMGLGGDLSATTTAILTAGLVAGIASTIVECAATIGQKWVLNDPTAAHLDDPSVQYYLSSFSLVFSFISFLDTTSAHGHHAPGVYLKPGASLPALIFTLLASAGLAFLSTLLAIKSLRKVSAARYTILDTFRRLLSSVLAVPVFGESLNLMSAVGLAVSLTGIYLYDRTTRRIDVTKKGKAKITAPPAGYSSTDAQALPQVLPAMQTEDRKCSAGNVISYRDSIQHITVDLSNDGSYSDGDVQLTHHKEEVDVWSTTYDSDAQDEYTPIMSTSPSQPVITNYRLKRSTSPIRISDIV